MIKKAAVFIAGSLAAYLLFAFGFFSFAVSSPVSAAFSKIMGVLAIIASLLIIKDFFGTLQVMFKNVSETRRAQFRKWWGKVLSLPSLFVIGAAATLLAFGGAHSTLLVLRNLYTGGIGRIIVLPLEVYYNVIVLLPLIAMAVALYVLRDKLHLKAEQKGPDIKRVERWHRHHIKLLNFCVSVVMLVLGIILLFS